MADPVTLPASDIPDRDGARHVARDGTRDGAPNGVPQVWAGLDIGGSKVLAVAVDAGDAVVGRVRLPTGSGAHGVLTTAVSALDQLAAVVGIAPRSFRGVGVGIPGLVDPHSGGVTHAVNLDVGDDVLALREQLEQWHDTPVVVENDVNAAALGAAMVLGAHDADLAYLSIGTGLAAGLVLGGSLRRGARGGAGEIGHVPVDTRGLLCRCGQVGCLETVASGTALAARWPTPAVMSPAHALFAAADTGDPRAVDVRDTFAAHVAEAVKLLVLTVDVEVVVLGGGVADIGDPLLEAVRSALSRLGLTSPFLRALELPSRVAVLPARYPVAAVGAALFGRSRPSVLAPR